MQVINHDPQQARLQPTKQVTYEPPAVIYEGLLTTRAGSGPTGDNPTGAGEGAVDPADLFGDG